MLTPSLFASVAFDLGVCHAETIKGFHAKNRSLVAEKIDHYPAIVIYADVIILILAVAKSTQGAKTSQVSLGILYRGT